MKNILLLTAFSFLFFNACKYPITVSSYDNSPEEIRENSVERISEFERYIVENTETRYDTTQIYNGTFHTEFQNASFENDFSQHSRMPLDWINCGDVYSSPVDIHSYRTNYFQVNNKASHGNNFVGMIVRSEGTYEAIGQELENSLDGGYTYSFSLFAARSKDYISLSRMSMKEENFNKPVVLQVYGGKDCTNAKLLISTRTIEHTDWAEYIFVFDADDEINFILIEAHYDSLESFPYNGNVLIDNISPIYRISK